MRLGARSDRVRRESLEEDERREDEQAEREQPPVRGRAPEPVSVERAQGFFPRPRPLPGTVATVVVVGAVVVVRLSCPGAALDLPGEVAVWPGADPERPGVVVVVVVVVVLRPGAVADLPRAVDPGEPVPAVRSAAGAGSAGTRSAGAGATGCGTLRSGGGPAVGRST